MMLTLLLLALLLPVAAFSQSREYHVVFSAKTQRWRVEWDRVSLGYRAWDKRVALSAAKELAQQNKPSKVVIHDRKGKVMKVIPYTSKGRKS